MDKNKVREILFKFADQQLMANLGGIIGGEENEQFAEDDLKKLNDAIAWFDKHIMPKKGIK